VSVTRSVTRELVLACLRMRVDAAALTQARRCVFDGLAVALAAAQDEAIGLLRRISGQPGASRLIGGGLVAEADAARLNGMMTALLLFDDNSGPMWGHPTAPLMPAVFAVAETEGLSLEAALRAFVVGYEVECRLGRVLNPSAYEAGWHATNTQGTIGAAIACAILLGLDETQTCRAIGIAASLAGGMRRNFGSMTMSLHCGEAAANAVRAVRLAQSGFTAHPDIFGRPNSYGEALSREWDEAAFVAMIAEIGVAPPVIVDPGPILKLYPCGQPTLYGVDCALALMRDHGVTAEAIVEMEFRVSYILPRTLIHTRPETALQAKPSMHYCVAATFVDNGPKLSSFTDAAVMRPSIRRLLDCARFVVLPEYEEHVPGVRARALELPVTVWVRLRDGREAEATMAHHRGMPQHPATEADLLDKFQMCAHRPGGPVMAELNRPGASVADLLTLVGEAS
jgi:2-methylcitrate dehydratase PrpD